MRCPLPLRFAPTWLVLGALLAGTWTAWPVAVARAAAIDRPATFCNPIDLDDPIAEPRGATLESEALAADPTVLFYAGEYWAFTSQNERHWHSRDFVHWSAVRPTGLPVASGSPAVAVLAGRLVLMPNGVGGLFTTQDPALGEWTKVADLPAYADPALFVDDDGRVFVFFGDAENGPIRGVELDPAAGFKVVRGPIDCLAGNAALRGWEVYGDENRGAAYRGRWQLDPWLQGAAMTRHAGRYYLQYAAPSAGLASHADGVFTGAGPLGPFTYAPYSPFSHKPTGFISGAAHGSLFADAAGNLWRAVGVARSPLRARSERLAVFPVRFLADGQLVSETDFGDFPQYLPGAAVVPVGERSPGWMLLSREKHAEASSMLEGFPADRAFDENAATKWSASSARAGEWLRVDLGKRCRIEALQIEFGDEDPPAGAKPTDDIRSYKVEVSVDGRHWRTIVDHQLRVHEALYDYIQLPMPVKSRHVRVVNVSTPRGEHFAIAALRLFGSGRGALPREVQGVVAGRLAENPRRLSVAWAPAKGADFHVVRYGLAPDRLFNNYQVYDESHIEIDSLNVGVSYYVAVDAVNDNGVRRGRTIVLVK